jgi:hypothetical protein
MSQTAPQLELHRETHTYTLGDHVLPSVTQIIKAAGLVDTTWFTETGRQTGDDVAYLTELYDREQHDKVAMILDERPELGGYLDAWSLFLGQSGFDIEQIEGRVYCTNVAGTFDRYGYLGGYPTVVDIKRYAHTPWHGVQLAGYAFAHAPFGDVEPYRRAGVHLKADGTYKLHRFEDPADYEIWHAIVRQYHGQDMPGDARAIRTWKSNHGVK